VASRALGLPRRIAREVRDFTTLPEPEWAQSAPAGCAHLPFDKWEPWVLVSGEKSLEISLDSEDRHTYSECNGVALNTT
jgi:hypothetical protein